LKILDRYILSRFLFNFFSSFAILMLIFIFQSIWFFIDELAGKGLDLSIIGKFLFYYTPNLVPNVLPLTVLLASIMTFGAFAENYEFAAMKSSGISLQRAMRSIIIFILFLSIATFYFANNIIPQAEYKSFNLRRNIAKVKPALAIAEGIFNNIGDINIKVDKKYGNNDNFLQNVILHKKSMTGVNKTVIKAKSGELVSNEDSDILQLILKDGNYYEDVTLSSRKNEENYPHAKANFKTYIMNVDLRELNKINMEEERNISTYKMFNVKELSYSIDSITKENIKNITSFGENLYDRTEITTAENAITTEKLDTITLSSTKDIIENFESRRKSQLLDAAINSTKSMIATLEGKKEDFKIRTKLLNLHIMALHNKFALAFSCVILFFVGAPLGAIIRKGGMGLPMVLAIGLFLSYYFIGIFAKNYAENGNISPLLGAWISTIIMLPLGILLTKRATADKNIVDIDMESFKNSFRKINRKTVKEKQ
jgi:lipopolysaccharide export system permease protein